MQSTVKPKIVHLVSAQAQPLEEGYRKILSSLCELEEIPYSSHNELLEKLQSQSDSQMLLAHISSGFFLFDADIPQSKKANLTLYWDSKESNYSQKEIIPLQEKF